MKKAKLMLSALAIFATVGTALAIKGNQSSLHYIYTGELHSGVCTVRLEGACIDIGYVNIAASTTALYNGCPDVFATTCKDF